MLKYYTVASCKWSEHQGQLSDLGSVEENQQTIFLPIISTLPSDLHLTQKKMEELLLIRFVTIKYLPFGDTTESDFVFYYSVKGNY